MGYGFDGSQMDIGKERNLKLLCAIHSNSLEKYITKYEVT